MHVVRVTAASVGVVGSARISLAWFCSIAGIHHGDVQKIRTPMGLDSQIESAVAAVSQQCRHSEAYTLALSILIAT